MKKLYTLGLPMIAVCIIAIFISSCEEVVTEGTDEDPASALPSLQIRSDVMFTGTEDHSISLTLAEQMMSRFQESNPFDSYAWYFSREAISGLLSQEECVGIRIYGGRDVNGKFSLMVFGVYADGADIKCDCENVVRNINDGESNQTSLDEAQQMMKAFREHNPFDAYGWYFSKDALEKLLFQEGCNGIRIYGGLSISAKFSPVIFGVDTDGRDIKINQGLFKTPADSIIFGPLEMAFPCPPRC